MDLFPAFERSRFAASGAQIGFFLSRHPLETK